jgi:PKD repeat protein
MLKTLCASTLLLALAATVQAQDLTLTSGGFAEAVVNQPFSYAIVAAPAIATGFTATGLPNGLTLNSSTGIISGTPTTAGTAEVVITASDANGVVSKQLRIDINANASVAIGDTTSTVVADVGTAFAYQVPVTGSATIITATGLPPGMVISAAGLITGTPTAGGTFPVSLIAANAQSTWVTSLNLDVYPFVPVLADRTITSTLGNTVRLAISATNLPTSYGASGLPAGLTLNPATGIITGSPTAAGTSVVTVTAANAGGTATATWTLIINPSGVGSVTTPNPFPVAMIGSPYTATITANGSPTGFSATGLPTGLTIDPTSGIITGTPATGTGGAFPVVVTASYAGGTVGTVANAVTMTVNPLPPVVNGPTAMMADLAAPFVGAVLATNVPTSFAATGLPPGLAIDPVQGVISGTATTPGTYAATISAANAGGTGSAVVTFTVPTIVTASAGTATAAAPVIVSSQSVTAFAGIPFSYSLLATNAPGTFAANGLPAGLSIDPATGIISGTPAAPGISSVAVSASNGSGTANATLTIATYTVPVTAIDSSLATLAGNVGTAFSYQVVATYAPTSFTATGLPPGLAINSGTGLISGTPTAGGSYDATLTVTNATGTVTDHLTIVVSPAAPSFALPANLVTTVGVSASFNVRNPSGGGTYTATGLPTGMSINASTGTISGTPTTAGNAAITVTATSSSGSDTVTGTIIVNAAGAPTITSPLTTLSVPVATPFAYTITSSATGATFAATGLPAGVTCDPVAGVVSGTPTVGGTYDVIISAGNGTATGSATLVINVTPAPPVITTTVFGVARVGAFYVANVGASNAPTAYAATGLPAGLAIDPVYGIISGTPTTAGTSTVTITATNAGGSGTATLPMTVNAAATPTITSPTTVYTVPNAIFAYQITALNGASGYSATGLPAGWTLNDSTGLLTGITVAYGTIPVVVTATNGLSSRSIVLDVVTVPAGSAGAPAAPVFPSTSSGGGGGGCGLGAAGAAFIMALGALLRLRRR